MFGDQRQLSYSGGDSRSLSSSVQHPPKEVGQMRVFYVAWQVVEFLALSSISLLSIYTLPILESAPPLYRKSFRKAPLYMVF
jgi:hypothetical protein